jgi:hypothetical protein
MGNSLIIGDGRVKDGIGVLESRRNQGIDAMTLDSFTSLAREQKGALYHAECGC